MTSTAPVATMALTADAGVATSGAEGGGGGGGGGGDGGGWASWLDSMEATPSTAEPAPRIRGDDSVEHLFAAPRPGLGDDAAAPTAFPPPVVAVGPSAATPAAAATTDAAIADVDDAGGPLRGFDVLDEEQRFAVASLVCVLLGAEAVRRRAAASVVAASKSSAAAAAASAVAAASSLAAADGGGDGGGGGLADGGGAAADGPFCTALARKVVGAVGLPTGAQAALLALLDPDAGGAGGGGGGGNGSGGLGKAAAERAAAAEAAAARQCARLVGGGAARLAALQALLTVAVVGGDYDARARVLLQRVAAVLEVEWALVAAVELAIAVHLSALHVAAVEAAAAEAAGELGGTGGVPPSPPKAMAGASGWDAAGGLSLSLQRTAPPAKDVLPAPDKASASSPSAGSSSTSVTVSNGSTATAVEVGNGGDTSVLPLPTGSSGARKRRRRLREVKAAKLSGITLAGGILFGLTGGLIAPALLASLAAIGVASAATLAATGTVASGAVVGSLFGVAGMGITGNKARRRLRTWVGEFEFERPADPRIARARARRADREQSAKGRRSGAGSGVTDAEVAVAEAAAVEAAAEIRASAAKKSSGGGRSWSRMLRGKSKRPSRSVSFKASTSSASAAAAAAGTKPPLPLPVSSKGGPDGGATAAAAADRLPRAATVVPSPGTPGTASDDLLTNLEDTEDFFGGVDDHTIISSGSSTGSSRFGGRTAAAVGSMPTPRSSSVPGASRSGFPSLEPSSSAPLDGRSHPDGSEASVTSAADIWDEEAYPDFPGGRAGLDTLDPSLHVTICVPAWLHESTYGSSLAQFEVALQTLLPYSQHAAMRWESGRLVQMGHAFARFWASKATVTTIQQAYPHVVAAASTVGGALAAAFALPLTVISCLDFVDNPWSVCISRANGAGEELADVLASRSYGCRPVTLIGYSLGARVVFKCLKSLAARGAVGIVDNAFLLGAPVSASPSSWRDAQAVVAGRLVNGYCATDWALAFFHRGVGHGVYVAGLRPVTTPGVENVDMGTFGVAGHRGLSEALPRALHALGVSTGRITMPPAPLPGSTPADGTVESTALVVVAPGVAAAGDRSSPVAAMKRATTVAAADGDFWLAENGVSAGNVAMPPVGGRRPGAEGEGCPRLTEGTAGASKRKGKHDGGNSKWFGSAWPSWSSPKLGQSRSSSVPAAAGVRGEHNGRGGPGGAGFDGVFGGSKDVLVSLPPPTGGPGAVPDAGAFGLDMAGTAGGVAASSAPTGAGVGADADGPAGAPARDPSPDLDAQFQAYLRRHNVQLASGDSEDGSFTGVAAGAGGDSSSGDEDASNRTVVLPLGIELTERRFRPFLSPGTAYPISCTHVLTNASDEQRGLVVRLWEGAVSSTVPLSLGRRGSRNFPRLLASVELAWARPRPRGTMRFTVSVAMDEGGDAVLRVSRQWQAVGAVPAEVPRPDPLLDRPAPVPVVASLEDESPEADEALTAEARIPASRLCSHAERRAMEAAEREGKRRSKAKDKAPAGGGGQPPLLALPAPPPSDPPAAAATAAAALPPPTAGGSLTLPVMGSSGGASNGGGGAGSGVGGEWPAVPPDGYGAHF